jgi:hypothetical protein
MTPALFFFYLLALTGGLSVAALAAGVLYLAWQFVLGWIKGADPVVIPEGKP